MFARSLASRGLREDSIAKLIKGAEVCQCSRLTRTKPRACAAVGFGRVSRVSRVDARSMRESDTGGEANLLTVVRGGACLHPPLTPPAESRSRSCGLRFIGLEPCFNVRLRNGAPDRRPTF